MGQSATYSRLLEDEIKTSKQFTEQNFGLKVGDGFPEMVKEICASKEVSSLLMISLLMAGISGKSVAESMKAKDENEPFSIGNVILSNLSTFEIPLSMFYWGIQVGRKLEHDFADALRQMERQ